MCLCSSLCPFLKPNCRNDSLFPPESLGPGSFVAIRSSQFQPRFPAALFVSSGEGNRENSSYSACLTAPLGILLEGRGCRLAHSLGGDPCAKLPPGITLWPEAVAGFCPQPFPYAGWRLEPIKHLNSSWFALLQLCSSSGTSPAASIPLLFAQPAQAQRWGHSTPDPGGPLGTARPSQWPPSFSWPCGKYCPSHAGAGTPLLDRGPWIYTGKGKGRSSLQILNPQSKGQEVETVTDIPLNCCSP